MHIFCVPHAGGSARIYRSWQRELGPHTTVTALDLPGRGRIGERYTVNSVPLAARRMGATVAEAIGPDSRYILFGHSLGALIAFEIAAIRHKLVLPRPALVVISSRNPPCVPPTWPDRMLGLPDTELLATLKASGALPAGLSTSIAIRYFLPRLRADLRMVAGYTVGPDQRRTDAPLLVLAGRDDTLVDPRRMARWADYTDGPFAMRIHDGGHYAVFGQMPVLAGAMRSMIG